MYHNSHTRLHANPSGNTLRHDTHRSEFGDAAADKGCKARLEDTRDNAFSRGPAASPGQHLKESPAADLAYTFTRTPQRATPNSAKKRRPLVHLSRSIASPGHGAKMSAIFQDASATLQGFQSSPYQPSLNLTRIRLPLSQARGIGFGSAAYADNDISPRAQPQSSGKKANREPVSSGLVTPSMPYSLLSETPEEIPYPAFETWQLPQSSSIASGFGPSRDGSQSSHGILEVTSFSNPNTNAAQSANIDSWLANIPTSTGKDPPSSPQLYDKEEELVTVRSARFSPLPVPTLTGQGPLTSSASRPLRGVRPLSRTSSNKENLDPVKSSPSPKRSPVQHLPSTPSRFRNTKTQPQPQSVGILRFAHPSTPQGHLSLPPTRKRTRTADQPTSFVKPATSTEKDFTIHEDQLAGALAELSPLVERHRKGRGPKRERCMSYFDEDVIEIGSPGKLTGNEESDGVHKRKDRQVLGESKNSAELTREKPFLEGIEEAAFVFHI